MVIEVAVRKTEPVTVAFLSMKGPYTLISESFGKLYGWIIGNGYEIVGPPTEVYLSNPAETPSEELLTEVRFPVRK